MPQICHAHCPDEGGGLAAVVVVAAAVVLGAVATVIDDIVITLAIAAVAAVAGSLAVLAWVLRREGAVAGPPPRQLSAADRQALPQQPRLVIAGRVVSGQLAAPEHLTADQVSHRSTRADLVRSAPLSPCVTGTERRVLRSRANGRTRGTTGQ